MSDLPFSDPKRAKKKQSNIFSSPSESHENFNKKLTDILEEIGEIEKNRGEVYKWKAYSVAVQSLKKYNKTIESGKEAQQLSGIGEKIALKIQEIIDTGKLKKLENELSDPNNLAINELAKVSYIGPAKARELVLEKNIKSIEELRQNTHLLNRNQKICLNYFEDFNKRIPRDEIDEVIKIVRACGKEVSDGLIIKCCGSYRRKLESSGDVDILVTNEKGAYTADHLKQLVHKLKDKNFIIDDLAFSDSKYMGVYKLDSSSCARRIDITLYPVASFSTGLLYFTGSGEFNRQMRGIALDKGYKLNEYGLYPFGITGVEGSSVPIRSEKDVFDVLGIPYRKPSERSI